MTLTFCSDVSAADWLVTSGLPWERLVSFGPPGFAAYARLRFLPDPAYAGQGENDVPVSWRSPDQMRTLVDALATHTGTPGDCYFCVWEGFGAAAAAADADADADATALPIREEQPGAQPALWVPPRVDPRPPQVPKVLVPHRAYYLFRGPLSDIGRWDAAERWPGVPRLDTAEPAFVWPADRAWCVANDVDPHWAGVGASTLAMAGLMTDARLDLVPADPTDQQPSYR